MSNSPNFFVQGKIDTHSDVYIVAKTTITISNGIKTPNIFPTPSSVNGILWSLSD